MNATNMMNRPNSLQHMRWTAKQIETIVLVMDRLDTVLELDQLSPAGRVYIEAAKEELRSL